jgi:hypothetical protein
MPTSVHLPKTLLEAVDQRAKTLKMSRNHLIIVALERELRGDPGWSASFFDRLAAQSAEHAGAVDAMMVAIKGARRSKAPLRF